MSSSGFKRLAPVVLHYSPNDITSIKQLPYCLEKQMLCTLQGWGELKNELELFNSIPEFELVFELKDFHQAEF